MMSKEQVRVTQRKIILAELLEGKEVSPADAQKLCGSKRLAAIIFDLRAKGYPIDTTMKEGYNRILKGKTRYAVYSIDKDWLENYDGEEPK